MTDPNPAEPQAEHTLQAGDVIAGKYRVERVIGQGGMGVVVAAEHTTLRQHVAVKVLLPEAAKRGTATERFLREARASVAIKSEHVARVMDVGSLDSGQPFMVMELLAGADLNAVLHERGKLPITEAVDYILQACEAIAEAHSLGIIHRDLKPANLFLTSRADGSPLVKVLDFGLSKVDEPNNFEGSLTKAGEIMGSPFYMSPEQIRSLKGLDRRTDIWALGVILYQLLCGVRPFEAEALAALFLMIGADPVPPMRKHRPDIPPELEAAVLRCLEKDVNARPQSVAELARLLAPFASPEMRHSVERIHRTLSDDTLSGRRASAGDLPVPTPAADVDDNAATVALNVSPAAGLPAPFAATEALPIPASEEKAQSGSMAAVATPVAPQQAEIPTKITPKPAAPAGKRGVVIGLVAALALGGISFAALRMRAPAGDAAAHLAATGAPAAGAAPPASVAVTSAPVQVASAAPVQAASAAPSASAPAAPSASTSAKPTKPPAPPPKKR
jgi:serine/threonine-protein kinase